MTANNTDFRSDSRQEFLSSMKGLSSQFEAAKESVRKREVALMRALNLLSDSLKLTVSSVASDRLAQGNPLAQAARNADEKVAARLSRVRLLCPLVHHGLAVEHRAAAPGGDAAVVLQAPRARCEVIDSHVRVEVARTVGKEQAGQFRCGARGREARVEVEPGERAAELRIVHDEQAALADRRVDALDLERLRPLRLQAIQVQHRIGANLDVDEGVHEALGRIVPDVMQDDACLAAGGGTDADTGMRHLAGLSGGEQRHLQGRRRTRT